MTSYVSETYINGALTERDVIDTIAGTLTVFNGTGQQQSTRPLTTAEAAIYAQRDANATIATNQTTLQSRAQAALTANATFLTIGSPTNGQTLAQVQTLTKECSALIRLALSLFDSTSGT